MKDYRSLETKIRKMGQGKLLPGGWEQVAERVWVHEIAEIARVLDEDGNEIFLNKAGERVDIIEDNTDKRRTVVNVGRPDTAKNPLDPKAKLVKQAEIKTKIIDERLVHYVKNVLDLLPIVRLMEKKKPEKKDDKDADKDDKKGKNPVVADKAKHQPGDPKVVDKKEGPKKSDGSSDDDKDPKKITGGKTEVDVHPTTNDKITDDSKETADSKKTTSKENKKIVKEQSAERLKDYVNKTGVHRDLKYPKLALKKIADKKQDDVKEDQIHEISDKRAGEYLDKSDDSWKKAKAAGDKHTMTKRGKGGSLATKKMLNVNVKVKTTKEEFSPEELAHFEAVMDEAYVDMSKKSCDEIINAKGKPHKVYTATDETRHGIGVDELKCHLGVGDSPSVHKKFMHNLHTAGVRTGWSHSAGKWIAYHGKKV